MWARIQGIAGPDDKGRFVVTGILENDPLVVDMVWGEKVAIVCEDIEDIYKEEKKWT